MNTTEIDEYTNKILDSLNECDELRIENKDGAICIDVNSETLDCIWIGKWGSVILSHCIRQDVLNKPEKFMVIAAHCIAYSERISGIVFLKLHNSL